MRSKRLDYIWLDDYDIANIRTKAQIHPDSSYNRSVEDAPKWGFDAVRTVNVAHETVLKAV